MDDLVFTSARDLAALIRDRHVSSVEVLDALLSQISHRNGDVNAIVSLDGERARQRAKAADDALTRGELWGPLHGVPFTIKDALETAGLRTTSGFPPLSDHVPTADATVVARLKGAGGILLGKTNLPTLAGGALSDNPLFGRTNNPWNLDRTPGGSSGGSSAALAAGMTPLDIGSDAAGSLRIPAHFCGVYALKPTQNLVPLTGHIPPPPPMKAEQLLRYGPVLGPLARSIDDLTLALEIIAGPDGADWAVPPVTLTPAAQRPLEQRRFLWSDAFGDVPVTHDTSVALDGLVSTLEQLGCRLQQLAPQQVDMVHAWETYGALWQAQIGVGQPPDPDDPTLTGLHGDDAFLRGMAQGVNATLAYFGSLLERRDALIAAVEAALHGWDALLCPVVGTPALAHGPIGEPFLVEQQEVPYWAGLQAYCGPFNLTGHPALVMPLTLSGDGLPIGVQLVGRRWGEMELLAVAEQLVEVVGPFRRPPGY